jgi:uncharacterized protein (DUF433 family)
MDMADGDRRKDEPRADALIAEHVIVDPLHGGPEDARLRDSGVPVWALIGHRHAADGDLGEIAEAYDLPLDAVLAAFAYYARHRAAINARIEANSFTSQ